MTDLGRMNAQFDGPELCGDVAVLSGEAPVAGLRDYWIEVSAYTRGQGRVFCTIKGYDVCHQTQEVVQLRGYDAGRDIENPADSIFCAQGAGYTVKWDEVAAHAHVESGLRLDEPEQVSDKPVSGAPSASTGLDQELEEIFVRTYGPIKNRGLDAFAQSQKRRPDFESEYLARVRTDDYLLVDGYNIIFSWDELNEIAAQSLDAARSALIHLLSSYQGIKRCTLILVFDAYRVKGNPGTVEKEGNISVVYTKEAETADMYIERASYQLSRKHRVKVATSDALEQLIILGHGAERISADELRWEVEQAKQKVSDYIEKT